MLSQRILRAIQSANQTVKYQIRPFCSALKNMEKEQVVPDVEPVAPKGEDFLLFLAFFVIFSQAFLITQNGVVFF